MAPAKIPRTKEDMNGSQTPVGLAASVLGSTGARDVSTPVVGVAVAAGAAHLHAEAVPAPMIVADRIDAEGA